MKRRQFIAGLAGVKAQQSERMRRIGVLMVVDD
jgi:hypothetical protein